MHLYLTGKLEDVSRPVWIVLMILGFIVWWPIGLGVLALMIWSGSMGCRHSFHRWHMREKWGRFCRTERDESPRAHWRSDTGNAAFEDYKSETLRRLEEEQNEFMEFLSRLRHAKDKAEFDQFMEDRRRRPQTPPEGPSTGGQPSA
jgi:hypothetical protein